jgi:exodeoxyribonuclease VII small subunit
MKQFEERLRRLEELSDRIRDPELPLEEAVAVFEEGIKLSKGLERDLAKIESRVEILLNQPAAPEDKPELGLFDQPGAES